MKFDLSSLVITVIALLAFIIPVSIDQRNKRKASKTLKKLQAYATDQKLNIDRSDVFQQTYALGLDNKSKKLLYVKNDGIEFVEDTHDLTRFSKCKLHHCEIKNENSEFKKVSYLRLQYANPKVQPLDLEIYKMKENLSYTEEESMAKKMVKSINNILS